MAEGVAHAPDDSVTAPGTAPTATRAAKNAARLTVVKLLMVKNIATSPTDAITFLSWLVISELRTSKGGPLLPGLCSPRFFFAFAIPVHRQEARSRGI